MGTEDFEFIFYNSTILNAHAAQIHDKIWPSIIFTQFIACVKIVTGSSLVI